MHIDEDLGEVRTWDEAVDQALALHAAGKIDAVTTISVNEFSCGGYVATPLRGMGFPEEQVLDNLRSLGPILYPGHDRLRLARVQIRGVHPEYPDQDVLSVFLIVYLKPEENVTVQLG